MNVYLAVPGGLSRAMDRVVHALSLYAPPNVTVVKREAEADLVVLHTIGYPETVEAVERMRARGQRYLIVQYCLRSTHRGDTASWRPL